jgi:Family of unknown function (DUF5330)
MRFLLRAAFWLSVVVVLLPASPSAPGAPGPSATEAMSAANAAMSDMSHFCSRQPDACAVGSQALNQFGHKAQTGAKLLYEFLTDKLGAEGSPSATPTRAAAHAAKTSQNSLTPADLVPPWRGPGSRPAS